MANRIKGITVEIGGDTTGLDKALKSVNSSIKTTQSSLRDVNRLLKLDPKNTELLSQKQKLLKDAIGQTKEKLDSLKTAQEQAKQQLESGDLGQDKYDALQREIVETEQELKRLQQEAENCNSALSRIDEVGQKMESVGNDIAGAGKKMMPVTLAIGGVGVAAVKTAADFDSAMSQVAAVSGATGDDFDALREKAREMGSKTKFSASEAAEAMNYMAMAGWKTEDMLDGIEGIMNLAAASGEDLATTSDIVTDALTAFGLSAKDSGHFADILAAASSNANTNVSMMGETFKYCAPIAGAMGYSAEDTAQAIGLMANSGIKGSQAGTALRTIMTKLQGDLEALRRGLRRHDHPDGERRRLHAGLERHPRRLPRRLLPDDGVGKGAGSRDAGRQERHVRLPRAHERGSGGHLEARERHRQLQRHLRGDGRYHAGQPLRPADDPGSLSWRSWPYPSATS